MTAFVAAAARPVLRRAGSLLSPAGHRGRLSILIFHQVLAHPDPMRPEALDAARFQQQLHVLSQYYRTLPLAEAIDCLRRNTLPARAASITFDDGYADNVDVALPLLQRLGLHATFFIATGFLDGGCMWNDRLIEAVRVAPGSRLDLRNVGLGVHAIGNVQERRLAATTLVDALKYLEPGERSTKVVEISENCGVRSAPRLMMTRAQLKELDAAGMDIGGHTVSHPILAKLDREAARAEIAQGKEEIEGLVRRRIGLFAYPNGRPVRDYAIEHVQLVRQTGFDAAVSTAWGAARSGSDFYQLPRFTPWDKTPLRFALRLLRNYTKPVEVA